MKHIQGDPSVQADIKKFIEENGVTQCPPGAAVLGEETPGFRRSIERNAKSERAKKDLQRLLTSNPNNNLPFVICRFADLVSWVRPQRDHVQASTYAKSLSKRYADIGAHFTVSQGAAKDKNIDWRKLTKILERARHSYAYSILIKKEALADHPSLVRPISLNTLPKPPQKLGGRYFVGGFDVRSSEFLTTKEWRTLRYAALARYGASCKCCGVTAADGGRIEVDHVKPRSDYPELAMDINNLQPLCRDCNMGKAATARRWGLGGKQ